MNHLLMPCEHKFKEYLNLNKLSFEPTTLIVGTFNPSLGELNKAKWFYGRFDNNLWDILPRLYGGESMRCASVAEWKSFCERHKIAITDLVSCIGDADFENLKHKALLSTFSDKSIALGFKQHEYVNVIDLLKTHMGIKNVYLTRGISESFWKKLWRPVEEYAQDKNIRVKTLLTPSGYAFYQQGRYNKLNPEKPIGLLEDFILMRWKENWLIT